MGKKKNDRSYLGASKQRILFAWLVPAVNFSMNTFFRNDLPGDDLRTSQANEVGL